MMKFAFALSAAVLVGGLARPTLAADEKIIEVAVSGVTLLVDGSTDDEKTTEDKSDEKTTKEEKVVLEVHTTEEASSDESSDDDVKKKATAKVRGRIIMIGPDGVRKEMELDEKQLKKFHLDVRGAAGEDEKKPAAEGTETSAEGSESAEPEMEERYVIGVQCEEADDVLRKHLKLEGKGLLVLEVREKTPAADAGLLVDDVIVAVGEETLHSRDDLVSAVHGSEGKELEVHIIRAGEAMTVKITPKKMKVPVVHATATVEGFPMPNILQGGRPLTALPGVLIDGQPQDSQDLGKLLRRLQVESVESSVQTDEEREKLESELSTLRDELKSLRDEIRQLQKSVKGE